MLPTLSIVVAYARRTRAIGYRTLLPWPRLSFDLHHFKRLTSGHAIIMGRNTFDSPEVGSRALPHRRNIVLTGDDNWAPPPGVLRAADWDEALHLAKSGFGSAGYDDGKYVVPPPPRRMPLEQTDHELDDRAAGKNVFVVGGGDVYAHALSLPICRWVFATEIDGVFNGDAFFPQLDQSWQPVPSHLCPQQWASHDTVTENGITYRFVTYHRHEHITPST